MPNFQRIDRRKTKSENQNIFSGIFTTKVESSLKQSPLGIEVHDLREIAVHGVAVNAPAAAEEVDDFVTSALTSETSLNSEAG